jgi:type IV fimbrial biogenesis protein FimT
MLLHTNKPKYSSGFTLLELLTALTIGSIVIVVGVPSFQGVMSNQRLTASTNEMVTTLNLARSEAIKRVTYVTVCKSSNGTGCTAGSAWEDGWIVFANISSATPGAVDVGDEIIRVLPALHQSISLTAIGNIGNFLTFRPSGSIGTTVANFSGTLTTCDDRGASNARGIGMFPAGNWGVSKVVNHLGAALVCP